MSGGTAWMRPVPTLVTETHFDARPQRCFAERPRNVYALLADAVARAPHGEALVDGAVRLNWTELQQQADALATALAQQGLRAGERVALVLGNRFEFVVILFALARLGAVAVPIGTRSSTPEIAYIVQDCGCVGVFCDAETHARIPAGMDAPSLGWRCTLDSVDSMAAADGSFTLDALRSRAQGLPTVALHPSAEEDAATILYTSGTTGRPKGAVLTGLGVAHSVVHYEVCMDLGPHDRSIVTVPMSHVTGLIALILTMARAAGTLIVQGAFKAAAFLELAARERMTHTILVPAMYKLCLLQDDFARHDLSHWRIGAYGGAPMAPATIAELAQRLPGLTLLNAYGATETTSPTTLSPPGTAATHSDSVGVALPCAEVKIVDPEGTELPRGESGEIWIRGPMVVREYWGNPKATAESFTEGFWHSGDVGTMDADGFVRVHDRIKDVINRGGYKVFSSEVEAVLVAHPQVVEAAVVGRPCPVLGERVHAFVVLRAPTPVDELRAYCAERLSDYKVPEQFSVSADPLPRNANGKLLKRQMRAAVAQG